MTACMNGESLLIHDEHTITGTDIIDLMLLGRTVPVFTGDSQAGWAWHGVKNLIHLEISGSRFVMARKCLMELLRQKHVQSIKVQAVSA